MGRYSDLLKDPRWQKKRLDIMNRDSFSCQRCFSTDKTLHVHHIKYIGKPWECPDKYLITLCEQCHACEEMIKSDVESYINDLAFEHGIIFIDITDILFVMREYLESHPNSKVVDVMKIIVKAVKNG